MKKFVVVVTCQGQPFYYFYKTLIGALFGYAKQYLKNNKYNTMNFTLMQSFILGNIDENFIKKR